jgi:hypothetical protein
VHFEAVWELNASGRERVEQNPWTIAPKLTGTAGINYPYLSVINRFSGLPKARGTKVDGVGVN